MQNINNLLETLCACKDAKDWAFNKDLHTVWTTCERSDWLLWLMKKMQDNDGWHNLQELTLAKARCTKTIIHLMKDERSIIAVNTAEQFGLGKATIQELDNAKINSRDAYIYAKNAVDNNITYAAYATTRIISAGTYGAAADAAQAVYIAVVHTNTVDYQQVKMQKLKELADIIRSCIKEPIINF